MPELIKSKTDQSVIVLTEDDVLSLHNLLCDHYGLLRDMEPISPHGVKDRNMLASAVSRQTSGYDGEIRHIDLYFNCATLIFGIVKNHAFHNGNKRVGFLCLIKHLFENGFVINSKISNEEIYDLLRLLAANQLKDHAIKYYKNEFREGLRNWQNNQDIDTQIKYLAFWIRRISVNKKNFLKNDLKISDLKKIIQSKGLNFIFENSNIEISKQLGFFEKLIGKNSYKKIYKIRSSKTSVNKETIKQIRKDFHLNDQYGFDNSLFYSQDFIDEEIRNYKVILSKLAKT